MTSLFLMLSVIALVPLGLGLSLLKAGPSYRRLSVRMGSVMLCALAFNLTFFWQELWLVIPKALTPGLHPVLFHNNHEWTGYRPEAELLQGAGALATLASGLGCLGGLAMASRASATWRLLLFWMAFQGLIQALTQVVIGTIIPGNDVGRAMAYLHATPQMRYEILAVAILSLGGAGAVLARAYPLRSVDYPIPFSRSLGLEILLTTLLAVVVVVPFRLPRNLVEVAVVPLFINLIGVGWLILGAVFAPHEAHVCRRERVHVLAPCVALIFLLLFFQLVLRHGIAIG